MSKEESDSSRKIKQTCDGFILRHAKLLRTFFTEQNRHSYNRDSQTGCRISATVELTNKPKYLNSETLSILASLRDSEQAVQKKLLCKLPRPKAFANKNVESSEQVNHVTLQNSLNGCNPRVSSLSRSSPQGA